MRDVGAMDPEPVPATVLADSRILVVDDVDGNVALVRRIFRHAGYRRVRGVTDAPTALEICDVWDPDLVILDLHMPRLDGIEFLRAIRGAETGADFVPVLVLTADVTQEALKSALGAGATDYANKPVDADELLLRTRNLLSIRASNTELKRHNATLANQLRAQNLWTDEHAAARSAMAARIKQVIESGGPDIALQPVVDLRSMEAVGFEALARFGRYDDRTPDIWFAEATSVGLGSRLELAAARHALALLDVLGPAQFLTVNVSPGVLLSSAFATFANEVPANRLVFEITEHEPVDDYEVLNARVDELRRGGSRIAIDDAGAGYSSMEHILRLAPEFIKLDLKLTRDVDIDPIKSALTSALVTFAEEVGCSIIAEGVEREGELRRLRELGVAYGQGFYLGRPELAAPTGAVRPAVRAAASMIAK